MPRIKFSNPVRLLVPPGLIAGHIVWLLMVKSQMNPDVIFPSWLLSNSKNLVSEVITMYPPLLFYIVNIVNNFAHNLFVSTTLIQVTLVVILDSLLFYYLKTKLGFKFGVLGLVIYIPWQVFFRGNYLWHDFATIPFVIVSFFYFEKYLLKQTLKSLLIASAVLACGYLFKLTVVYVYILYFIWVVIIKWGSARSLSRSTITLFSPLLLAFFVNFLIILSKSTLAFTFYWNIIMQMFIYPRLPALSRPITSNYYPVIGLLMIMFFASCFIIWKYSKESSQKKWFLFSFALVSLANIYPRWSDFHLQLFLFPFSIVSTYALSLVLKLKGVYKSFFIVFFAIVIFFSLILFANRISIEIKSAASTGPDHILKFAPNEKAALISGRNVFIYDYALYDDKPYFDTGKKLHLLQDTVLGLVNPDDFHHSVSWQKALEFVESNQPDTILIPYQIKNKMDRGNNLTGFEKLILEKYHQVDTIADYFVYAPTGIR